MINTERRRRTLSATTPHGVFTRATTHPYTHVVVIGGELESHLRTQLAEYEARPAHLRISTSWGRELRARIGAAMAAEAAGVSTARWCHTLANAQRMARHEGHRLVVRGIYPVDSTEVREANAVEELKARIGSVFGLEGVR